MSWLETITSVQFVRFALVGLSVNLIGYCVYLLVTFAGLAPALAVTLLFGVGTVFSFVGNRRFTFRGSGSEKWTAVKYALVYLFGYILNLSLLYVFVDHFGLPHQAVQAAAIFIVAGVMFVLSKFFVFSDTQDPSEDPK